MVRWVLLVVFYCCSVEVWAMDHVLARRQFEQALQSIGKNDAQFQILRKQLADYPLKAYLDYYWMRANLDKETVSTVRTFMLNNSDLPLSSSIERLYLHQLASKHKWSEYLEFYPKEPYSIDLKCYYYRAKWGVNEEHQAIRGAKKLWLQGRSLPKACDPLFKRLQQEGLISQRMVYQRIVLAFEARQPKLLRYLVSLQKGTWKSVGRFLLSAYAHPGHAVHQLAALTLPKGVRSSTLISILIRAEARRDPAKALQLWQSYGSTYALNVQQKRILEREIAYRFLLKRDSSQRIWLDRTLLLLDDVKLSTQRVRMALSERDWNDVLLWVERLPKSDRNTSRWIYWLARAKSQVGQIVGVDQILRKLSCQRDYYGFLAAERLGAEYPLYGTNNPYSSSWTKAIVRWPGLLRVKELLALKRIRSARSEWLYLLNDTDQEGKLTLAAIALDNQWQSLSIQATIKAHAWDLLEFRFPKPMLALFQRFAERRSLDLSLLYALARQESALYENARSYVGARGLMQLMPGTARQVARQVGFRFYNVDQLYHPESNLLLGSAYLKQLIESYDGNRIYAMAAYNAGPSRVKRWLKQYADLPLDLWVELIPYRETRNYVQNVLSYNLIYQHLLKGTPRLLNHVERQRFMPDPA